MRDQSQKCVQKTLWDTDSVIFSGDLVGGQKPFGSQESQTAQEFLVQAFRASPSVLQESSEGLKTSVICGQSFTVSSISVALRSLLGSKLQARMDVNGSMEYQLIWKNWVTSSGRQICALRASGRRISGNGSIGVQSGWPTPAVQNATGGINPEGNTGEHFTLQTAASMTGWPTPTTIPDAPNMSENRGDGIRRRLTPQSVAGLVGWGTPRVTTNGGISSEDRALLSESRLEDQVQGWSTPSARDWKDTPGMSTTGTNPDGTSRERLDQLPRQIHGATGIKCSAETGKRGALDAQFSRWLMGFPETWDVASPNYEEYCALQAAIASDD
jgi:hypothetical protein